MTRECLPRLPMESRACSDRSDGRCCLSARSLIYFYAHYGFASITAHVLAMYPPFLAILLAKQAPIGLIVFAFACFANLSAGLTNYGTTPAPMFFAQEYVPLRGLVANRVHHLPSEYRDLEHNRIRLVEATRDLVK